MKVYSIGREAGCDIVINDSTDVISRRHAVLNVMPSGKMTITDQSHNGTYVNGIRISQNVPVPVTRKDNISFAHVARLDWNMVPKTTTPIQYAAIAVVIILLVGCGIFGYNQWSGGDNYKQEPEVQKTEQQIKNEVADSIAKEQVRKDSIEKVKQDSINKANKAKKDSVKNKTDKPKPKIKKEEPKKEEPKKKSFR